MRKIIVANWKMSPQSAAEAKRLFKTIKTKVASLRKVEPVIAPPFIYLSFLRPTAYLKLGSQDIFSGNNSQGSAWTGEISGQMLKNLKVSYVIVGHSERRELGETEEIINKKMYAALSSGMKAILCVGEKEKSREAFPAVVRQQLKSGLKGLGWHFASRTVVAYEPVWAISTHSKGKADTPQNFFEMSIYIRRTLLDIWGKKAALKLPILYGGSVNMGNAEGFLEIKGSGGLLVGKSSLDAEEFKKILELADKK